MRYFLILLMVVACGKSGKDNKTGGEQVFTEMNPQHPIHCYRVETVLSCDRYGLCRTAVRHDIYSEVRFISLDRPLQGEIYCYDRQL